MIVRSGIAWLRHRELGRTESVRALALLIFSRTERARYRRLANASLLLRMSLNPWRNDEGGGFSGGTRHPTRVRLLGVALVALLALFCWQWVLRPGPGRHGATIRAVAPPPVHPCHLRTS